VSAVEPGDVVQPVSAAPRGHRPVIAPPVHVPRPAGPWQAVVRDLAEAGTVTVYATWGEWLPALLATPRLAGLLGRDWERYRATQDPTVRYRFAASRALIKYTAAAALRTDPEAIDVAQRLGGRPYLRGLDQVEISLTHSGELMAVGLSRMGRIGLDAERADRQLRMELVRAHMCTPAEAAELDALPERLRSAYALRLWTLKEAYTKAIGQGMRLAFTEFGFCLAGGDLRTPHGENALGEEWGFATCPVLGRYLLSTACHDAGLAPAGDTSVGTMVDRRLLSAMTPPADVPPPAEDVSSAPQY
jgi:4'-phosphopantetheinyl transferase